MRDGVGMMVRLMERVKGIEPSYEAWEAAVLPLNYTRIRRDFSLRQAFFSGYFLLRAGPGY
jgi:hypothetical protein